MALNIDNKITSLRDRQQLRIRSRCFICCCAELEEGRFVQFSSGRWRALILSITSVMILTSTRRTATAAQLAMTQARRPSTHKPMNQTDSKLTVLERTNGYSLQQCTGVS